MAQKTLPQSPEDIHTQEVVSSASFICTEGIHFSVHISHSVFWEVRIHRVHFWAPKMLLENLESSQATSI